MWPDAFSSLEYGIPLQTKIRRKKRHDNILFQIEKQKIMPLYGKNKSKFTKRNKKNKTILNKITRYQKLRREKKLTLRGNGSKFV